MHIVLAKQNFQEMRILLLLFHVSSVLASNIYWYDKTNTLSKRQLMVNLYEWKWTDIAKECEDFLQYYGYGAVQISPPQEHVTMVNDHWSIRWRPVSYRLESRGGSAAELRDMVSRCNKVGVRIVADVVLNHMAWLGIKNGVNGYGSSGGSDYNANFGFESFPAVPFTAADFNDFRCNHSTSDPHYPHNEENAKNCRHGTLLDLNQANPHVRERILSYLNELIEMGMAGFRVDGSAAMWTTDLEAIFDATTNLREDIFGSNQRAFVVYEIGLDQNSVVPGTKYLDIGRVTNFDYGDRVSAAAKGETDWKELVRFGPGYDFAFREDHDVLNFIDTHDTQRNHPHVVTYKDGDKYRMAVSFMLAWPYGYPRVMSGYRFTDDEKGPPNSGAATGYATTSPTFNADGTCDIYSGWECEHRWSTIREMAKFRSVVTGTAVDEIFTDYNRLAFARNGKGFFALNGQNTTFSKFFQTTLPAGDYCDQYGGSLHNKKCTGDTITVRSDGTAFIQVPGQAVVAISFASKVGGPPSTDHPIPSSFKKTVVFLKKSTSSGEFVFIRGGTRDLHQGNCKPGPFQQPSDPCAIPIVHNTTVPFVFDEYLTWSDMDNYLDFEGAEQRQGTHDGQPPFGTPLAYSTNNTTAIEYQPLNKYGEGYWMVQLYMDCTKTDQGWFELKGYVSPDIGSEMDIHQSGCSGSIGGSAPFSTNNHIAKCGAVNVFEWGEGGCTIDSIYFGSNSILLK